VEQTLARVNGGGMVDGVPEAMFNFLVADIVDECVLLLRDQVVIFSNAAAQELLGGDKAVSLVGRSLVDYISEDYMFIFRDGINASLTDDLEVPLKINAADGSARDLLTTFRLVGNEQDDIIVVARDVTEKNRSAWESVAREYLHDEIINNVTDGLVTFRGDGRIHSFNHAAEAIFDVPRDEAVHQHLSLLFPQLEVDRTGDRSFETKRQIEKWVRSGGIELTGQRANGENVDLEMGVSKIQFQGSPLYAAVLRDISDRKMAEQTLRESEKKYRRIVDTALEGFWFVDPNLKTIEVNTALCRMLGYEPEEMVGRSSLDFMLPEAAEALTRRLATLDNKSTFSYQETLTAKDGSEVHTVFSATPLVDDDGQLVGRFAFVSDVTDVYRREKDLQESRALLKAIIDNAPTKITLSDLEQKYVLVNEQFGSDAGLPGKDVVGKTPFDLFPKEMAESHVGENEVIIRTNEVLELDQEVVRDDEVRYEHVVKFPVCGEDGKVTGVGAIISDVTNQRLLDERMRGNDRLSALGHLAGGVAHDFNNILMIIGGYTRLAMRDAEMSDQSAEALGIVINATENAAGLTKQLLAFGRQQHLEVRTIKVGSILDEIESMLMPLLGETVQLKVSCLDAADSISTDTALFTQAIVNLSINARHAMENGGNINITTRRISLSEDDVSGWECEAGEFVEIAVTDTGTGMDAKTVSRIFEPFFTTKDQGKGTGLGLAMVYGFVTQSKGMINVQSEVGTGTTISLRLPVSEAALAVEAMPATDAELLGHGETILLAEDNDSLRDLIQRTLEEFGYNVISAADGFEALELESDHDGPIDMLLSDVVMPNLGGGELSMAIRKTRPDTRIVFMSGYPARGETHQANLPADVPLLDKPITPDLLARAVRNELDRDYG